MFIVKVRLQPSAIEGLGVFADEDIPSGATIWKFDSRFDLYFDPKDVEQMEPIQKEYVKRYAYLSMETGKYVFSIDDSRFTNHSKDPNMKPMAFSGEPETRGVAARDIAKGEELLLDYRTFDLVDANNPDPYLIA